MKIFVNVKQLGKRRNAVEDKEVLLDAVPGTVAELIVAIVIRQVEEYNERLEQNDLLKYLTDEEIKDRATTGKVSFEFNYNDPCPGRRKMAVKIVTEKSEIARLTKIYKNLPPNKFAVAQGLIVQAARLRVRLNQLWEDIQENGETERFTQSEKTEPYERERPAARLFTSTDKNYQAIIKQLNELTPPSSNEGKLKELMRDG